MSCMFASVLSVPGKGLRITSVGLSLDKSSVKPMILSSPEGLGYGERKDLVVEELPV